MVEHERERNRKIVVVGLPTLLLLISLGIVCRFLIAPPAFPEGLWIGVAFGLVLGVLGCWYLAVAWDPANLQPMNPKTRTASGCWLPVAVIGSTIASRIVSTFFHQDFTDQLAVSAGTVVYMTFGYIAIQAWRHRPGTDRSKAAYTRP